MLGEGQLGFPILGNLSPKNRGTDRLSLAAYNFGQ